MSEFQTSGIDSLDQPGRSFQETGVHTGLERSGCAGAGIEGGGAACSPFAAVLLEAEATAGRGNLGGELGVGTGACAGA